MDSIALSPRRGGGCAGANEGNVGCPFGRSAAPGFSSSRCQVIAILRPDRRDRIGLRGTRYAIRIRTTPPNSLHLRAPLWAVSAADLKFVGRLAFLKDSSAVLVQTKGREPSCQPAMKARILVVRSFTDLNTAYGLALPDAESDLDQVHPRGVGRGEVRDEPRVLEPLAGVLVLVRGVVSITRRSSSGTPSASRTSRRVRSISPGCIGRIGCRPARDSGVPAYALFIWARHLRSPCWILACEGRGAGSWSTSVP